jgi:2-oxoglutarate ferredoxin oxidoreductase subunit beta
MSAKNPEYDFKWCPGCGDFGVRRALQAAVDKRVIEHEKPIEQTVVVAGIGCSGNMVHLLEEDRQPFGFHGIHGRTLPAAFGIKMARPELDVIVVAGDGDFLSIGMEHIGPQAARNLNIAVVIMDNAVYGLTKGQSSPTTGFGDITSSTPYGKPEDALNPLNLYLTLGVSFVASGLSSKVKDLSAIISDALYHPGFAIVHVQSPCTTYNDNYEALKGNPRKGIPGLAWEIPDDHDPTDMGQAYKVANSGGVPLGLLYVDEDRTPFEQRAEDVAAKAKRTTIQGLVDAVTI